MKHLKIVALAFAVVALSPAAFAASDQTVAETRITNLSSAQNAALDSGNPGEKPQESAKAEKKTPLRKKSNFLLIIGSVVAAVMTLPLSGV
jgi:hypothetical protein